MAALTADNPHGAPAADYRRRTAVFTIASKNYLPYARVLMRSLQDASPDWDRFLLLADTVSGAFDPAAEAFTVVEAAALPIPDIRTFFFRYTILELNTAVKPWFFRYLFSHGYDSIVYLDPDIFVYAPLREVDDALTGGALAVLVPHLTGRLHDTLRPSEHDILQSGAYNLGFCALGRHPSVNGLLDFWCEKSVRDFVSDLPRGLFTDQRWMDLVPGMFPDVRILRHEGYDVAYWNLPHRQLSRENTRYLVNGVPLVFFHYSGVDWTAPSRLSKHQNRYRLETAGPEVTTLVRAYCVALQQEGISSCAAWSYAYSFLEDGNPLPDVFRKLYRTRVEVEEWAGPNPFARTAAEWNESLDDASPPLTRAMLAVYQIRGDIRLTWPDVTGLDREQFARWFANSSEVESLVPACYIDPVRDALASTPAVTSSTPRLSRRRASAQISASLVRDAMRKAMIAFRDGRLPISPRRWIQLFRLHAAEAAQAQLGAPSSFPPLNWPERRPRRRSPDYAGFYAQSPGEMSLGVAWMGRTSSVRLAGAAPAMQVTIVGHHVAAAHLKARGTEKVTLQARLNDVPVGEFEAHQDGAFEFTTTLPPDAHDHLTLVLNTEDAFVPATFDAHGDRRELTVQVRSVMLDGHPLLDFSRSSAVFQPRTEDVPSGLTLVGYLSDGTGVAAGVAASAAACSAVGLDYELVDARPLKPWRGQHPINLLHVNADQTPTTAGLLGDRFFADRYTIGFWAWELEELPDNMTPAFGWVDEVWALSSFTHRAIADKSPVPVVHMPFAVTVAPTQGLSRRDFGLSESPFLFVMMYDALSVQERKNPLGAIDAFRSAFPRPSQVGLVIRVNHASARPEDVEVVRREVEHTPGATLIDRPLSRADAQGLLASCDALVSLHRSEGLGLNIAECMLLGKPVIATGWSGNMDFTTAANSCLVNAELVALDKDYGPYRRGNRWAEPDLQQAADYMRRLVDDREYRATIADRGRRTIADEFSPRAVGLRYMRRLRAIQRLIS